MDFLSGSAVRNPPAMQETQRFRFDLWIGKIPWRRAWQPTPVFLPGESHGQSSLVGTVHGVAKSQTQLKWLNTYFGIWDMLASSLVAQSVKKPPASRRPRFSPWVRKTPWRRKWQPTPVFLPGETHGQRNLEGYSPWGCRVRHNWVTNIFTFICNA